MVVIGSDRGAGWWRNETADAPTAPAQAASTLSKTGEGAVGKAAV